MIKAEIVADSFTKKGNRITTMVVTFPRFILAELNTHRMFSRNSASSRAIPFKKMVKSVIDNPFIPMAWQKDHPGMQGTEYLSLPSNNGDIAETTMAMSTWLSARNSAVKAAEALHSNSNGYSPVTKQLCNRLLEPFMWHTVIVTATEWENFFALRCPQYHSPVDTHFRHRSRKNCIAAHSNPVNLDLMSNFTDVDWLKINKGQAEIHMMALAEAMWDAYNESTPKELKAGEWHIPFGENLHFEGSKTFPAIFGTATKEEENLLKVKIATAMCARISYTVVGEEGKPANYENDLKLHDNLAKSGHWSPFEHCARAMDDEEYKLHVSGIKEVTHSEPEYEDLTDDSAIQGWSGNFRGFIQYRKTFNNENIV